LKTEKGTFCGDKNLVFAELRREIPNNNLISQNDSSNEKRTSLKVCLPLWELLTGHSLASSFSKKQGISTI